MDFIKVEGEWPQLNNTLLVASFYGWNDAAEAASTALDELAEKVEAEPFAEIDAEEFFVFTENRPEVRLNEDGVRQVEWPSIELACLSNVAGLNRSLVVMTGPEPDLKWRTFTEVFADLCRRLNVTEVLFLGAMVGPVPHTRTVPVTTFSTNSVRKGLLEMQGGTGSRYEGPTGILGVLANQCREMGLDSTSIWAVAPSYLSASPNWKVSSRILNLINLAYDLGLDLSDAQSKAQRFDEQVAQALARQNDVATFVQALEENYDRGENFDDELEWSEGGRPRDDDTGELPSADVLIRELERQLRENRENDKNS